MKITRILTTTSFALLLAVSIGGCKKKDGESTNPDDAPAEGDVDPMDELRQIPADIQGEIDMVLKPITDAEKLMADIETAPERLSISAEDLGAALKGAFEADVSADAGGAEASVSVDLSKLDVTEEARAEIQAMIDTLKGIKAGIVATPENVAVATKNIVEHGARGVAVGAKVTASLTAKLKFAKGEKAAELNAQVAEVEQITADLKGSIEEAKSSVMEIPAKATEMGANLAASFAGSASAG